VSEQKNIGVAQLRMAAALNREWQIDAPVRCFRALFHHPTYGWRVAQMIQRRGLSGFDIGVVRDIETDSNGDQLHAYSLSTVEAVVWLGIYRSDTEYSWDIVL
jgi:hypothetical protein